VRKSKSEGATTSNSASSPCYSEERSRLCLGICTWPLSFQCPVRGVQILL